ncbi:ERI1 exoribonuclease 3 isoform X2 [Notamacropus eugenii]|uniref:ERI1 exoribonuclease 3 isoform X2 n=1 Tax=Notamacropus eugenii TaxID=9315 RepID=UPI003B673CFD
MRAHTHVTHTETCLHTAGLENCWLPVTAAAGGGAGRQRQAAGLPCAAHCCWGWDHPGPAGQVPSLPRGAPDSECPSPGQRAVSAGAPLGTGKPHLPLWPLLLPQRLSRALLPGQCQYLGLPVADYFKQWINLKKAYSFAMGSWPKNGLLDMNKGLNLQHIGRPHSGIDDCKNIANIMKTLAHRGFIFKQTSKPF